MKNNHTMFPSCFSNPSSPTFKSHQVAQSLITTICQTQLCNNSTPTYLTLTWSKTLHSHSLTINASNSFSITISLKHPSKISFFKSRSGYKHATLYCQHHQNHKIKLFWDFTRAKFSSNSAEPDSCFYIAISSDSYIEFLLGDLPNEAVRRTGASQMREYALPSVLSRREHVFGRKSSTYSTRAQFLGSKHEIMIECSGGELKVKVDGKVGLVVKRIAWKFRGNERIMVGRSDVEFYWDVYNWIVGGGSGGEGHGVFVFQVGDGGVWPEIAGLEKRLMRKTMLWSSSSACSPSSMVSKSSTLSPSCSSVLQWAEESSDGGRSSSCASSRSCGSNGGFSLLLYAWNSD